MTYTEYCKQFYNPQEIRVKELIVDICTNLDQPLDMRKIDELAYEIETLKRLDWDGYRLLQRVERCEKKLGEQIDSKNRCDGMSNEERLEET